MFEFPRSARLRGKSSVERLFREGTGGFVWPLRYVAVRGEGRVLVSVPKKFHKKAVVRNLLKRRIREAWRLSERAPGIDVALIYGVKEVVDYQAISSAVGRIIERLNKE